MTCDHCGYNCNMKGKHGEFETICKAIAFARDNFGNESISIGGGEPTMHPDFFKILDYCLNEFDYVWLATNGNFTDKMWRLSNIINNCDYESFDDYCTCETDEERDNCDCYPKGVIYQENKLTVALSLDPWHNPIDERLKNHWIKQSSQHKHSGFEIRDVSRNISANGRGKNLTDKKGCLCSDIVCKPDGKLKLCGCNNAPKIGDICNGISEKWSDYMLTDDYSNYNCFNKY